ncbi:helix-turn-helix domain-containing protein [Frankia torreyi]|uniref:helix-turn-helix domain-containing protein n=1 Tax=Frankia torreyi TaxID=1856 RepID=UPI003BB50514
MTAREREIVSLATRGLSNLEISARLVISVRTVEGHILRAGQRLGVRGRTGLAAAVWGDTPAFEDE